MKLVLLFPGQGSQHHQLLEYYQDPSHYHVLHTCLNQCSSLIKTNCIDLLAERSSLIHQTEITQPLILSHSLGVYHLLQPALAHHDIVCVAGHSLGELTAACAVGLFDTKQAMILAHQRAVVMQECMLNRDIAMHVVLGGLSVAHIDQLIQTIPDVWLVNDNCDGQVVIGGLTSAVDDATAVLKEAGARKIIPLPMSVVSHCPMLEQASVKFKSLLTQTPHKLQSSWPVASNHTLTLTTDAEIIIDHLSQQLVHRVQFRSMIQKIGQGIDLFIEVGPGSILTNLVKKIIDVPCMNTSNSEQLQAVCHLLKGK
jgi:[acyl-carrier-protein] S-malonyltransferase